MVQCMCGQAFLFDGEGSSGYNQKHMLWYMNLPLEFAATSLFSIIMILSMNAQTLQARKRPRIFQEYIYTGV